MAVPLVEIAKLSLEGLSQLVALAVIETTEFGVFNRLLFETESGSAHSYDQLTTLPVAKRVGHNATTSQGEYGITKVTKDFKRYATEIPIDTFTRRIHRGQGIDPRAVANLAGGEAIRNLVDEDLITGDTTSNSLAFDGFEALIDSAQEIDAGGATFNITTRLMNQAFAKLKVGRDSAFWVMHSDGDIELREVLGGKGGVGSHEIIVENFDGRPVLTYRGMPVFVNDFSGNGANTGDVWLAGGGPMGLRGVVPDGAAVVDSKVLGQVPGAPQETLYMEFVMLLKLANPLALVRIKNIDFTA